MHTVVFGWFGASAVWFIPLFWRLVKAALPGGAGLRGPGTIRLWLGFVCVMLACCTLEGSLVSVAGVGGLGHALAAGVSHLLGHIGTPLAAVALLLVALPWLIDFRWRDFAAWADGAFGLGLTRGLAKRDEDARRHRTVDDGISRHASSGPNTMTPRSNGRYARPTAWRPPAGGRGATAGAGAASSAGLSAGVSRTANGRDAAGRGAGASWRAGADKLRRQSPQSEPVLRTGTIGPPRQPSAHTPDTTGDTRADKPRWMPTEPVAPAGWLREPGSHGSGLRESGLPATGATARPATVVNAGSSALPATPARERVSPVGRRMAGEQRQAGTPGMSAALAGMAGATAAHAAAAQTARTMSGAASGLASGSTAHVATGVGRSAATQRPGASGATSVSQHTNARQPASGTPQADQITRQSARRSPLPAPTYTRPMATTEKITPPASVQETLRSIAENAARWTDIAGVSLARSTGNVTGSAPATATPSPADHEVAESNPTRSADVRPAQNDDAVEQAASVDAAQPSAPLPVGQSVPQTLPAASIEADGEPVVQWPIEPPAFYAPAASREAAPIEREVADRSEGSNAAPVSTFLHTPTQTPVPTEASVAATTPGSTPVAVTPASAPLGEPVQTATPAAAAASSLLALQTRRVVTPTPFQVFAANLEAGDEAAEPTDQFTAESAAEADSVTRVGVEHAPDGEASARITEPVIESTPAPWESEAETAALLHQTIEPERDASSHAQAPVHHEAPLQVQAAAPTPVEVDAKAGNETEANVEATPEYEAELQAEPLAALSPVAHSPVDAPFPTNIVRFPHPATQVAQAAQATPAAPPVGIGSTDEPPAPWQPEAPAERADTIQRAPLRGHGPTSGFEFHAPAASMVELPTLDLLARADTDVEPVSEEKLIETGLLIEQRLQEFKVPVTVVGHSAGPVITRFEIEPALGVRGSQIVGLMKDLSRGLGLTSIRVVETIPGKTCMGLELPNAKRQTIRLSEILEAHVYQNSHSQLTLAMGKDITGHPVVADLAKAPHMLVAGTTGSGKSVAINAMICSLLYKATPEEVRLIMIDPKMLELSVYEGIPHLLAPVVTDMKLAANALNWCVGEMEKRYRLMSAVGVRNLAGFNQKIRDTEAKGKKLGNPFSLTPEAPEPLAPLPLIVVVIDELADLMMVAGKKIEELIARLAQKARAAGIHLILATQRPSVDVITGLIKANIPTRVAFQVSSKIDSRTILDQMGAESLLGQGDMLFLPPGTGYPQRVHGAFVADEEVHRIVEYLKQFGEPQYEEGILDGPATDGGAAQDLFGESPDAEADPLYDEAVAFVVRTRRASISSVQRQLRIGYNRAARLVEQMESAGLVSAMGINGSREVLAPGAAE